METSISFTSHEIDFELTAEDSVSDWILRVISAESRELDQLDYIFSSDEFVLELNQKHLEHDYFTDILTFPFTESESDPISGEIYISIDRVKDNAKQFNQTFEDELHRVMIHGVLHLMGQDDHGDNAQIMREREQAALSIRNF